MNIHFSHILRGDVLEISLKDENCDAMNSTLIKEKILELIEKCGSSKVVMDLSCLQFIDSSGLGSLLALQRSLNQLGGKMKIACLNEAVETVFEIVSMHRIFEIYPTVDDAVKSF